jgi:formate dehydrogenase beta subunit
MLDGHVFKAYQPGGPSSGLLPASMHDVPLDFDTLQPHGTFIGSAAVVVLSDKDSARGAALNMLRFFERKAAASARPAASGCEKAVKLMQADRWDRGCWRIFAQVLADASICGLGQAAPNPIRLTMKHFPEEV